MVRPDGDPETLPGLEPPAPSAGPLEQAVHRTLAALREQHAITERDAAREQLALELAGVIREKRQTRRTSTIGNDAKVLLDILDGLAPTQSSEQDVELRRVMEEWASFIRGQEQGSADAASPEVPH